MEEYIHVSHLKITMNILEELIEYRHNKGDLSGEDAYRKSA